MNTTLIAAVQAYAIANYDKGWDIVVECYEAVDIAGIIGGATTARKAVALMAAHVGAEI